MVIAIAEVKRNGKFVIPGIAMMTKTYKKKRKKGKNVLLSKQDHPTKAFATKALKKRTE